ncbi:MAG: hypothetical protein MRY74_06700 [Neomegalonema sp.]|nr:hypothetical protein [Neomegalonema sp.]
MIIDRIARSAARAAAFAAAMTAFGLSSGADRAQAQLRPVCLSDIAAEAALSVGVVSRAPSPLCEPAYRIVEIRNRSGAPLGNARLELKAPDGPGQMPFLPLNPKSETPHYFEMSADDGATWKPIAAPKRNGDRLVWTVAEAPMLGRLGPNSAPDDSLLLRWRAPIGEIFGGPYAPGAAIGVSGAAVDACGLVAKASFRETVLTTLKPRVAARLVGRNADRGGPFSDSPTAAPGDMIEWRLEVDNTGAATARALRAEIYSPTGPIKGAKRTDRPGDRSFAETGVMSLRPVSPGGRRAALFRMRAPASCERKRVAVALTYGCAAPPPGKISPIRAEGEEPRSWLATKPERSLIKVTPTISGGVGRTAPGSIAEITVTVENSGAPIFEPVLEISPPDGFVIPRDAKVSFTASLGAGRGRIVGAVLEPGEGDAVRARFSAAAGVKPILGTGQRIVLRLTSVRRRATLSESDEASAALSFKDGCGAVERTPTARARTALRQAKLEMTLAPVGPPIVTTIRGAKEFIVTLKNVGKADAEAVTLTLAPGAAWGAKPPASCRLDKSASGAFQFQCPLDGPLRSGESRELRYRFTLAAPLDFEAEAYADGLRIKASAEARAAGAPKGAVLARARAEAAVVGFMLTQKLTTPDGSRLDPARAIDLGQRVAIELTARWFGAAGRKIGDVALTSVLPAQLGLLETSLVEGDVEIVGLRTPTRGRAGRLLWSLKAVETKAYARLRIVASAIDVRAEEALGRLTASLSRGVAEADAIFSIDGVALGVDSARGSPTKAPPLPLLFRRPDLRLELTLKGAKKSEPAFGERSAAPGGAVWTAPPGRVVVAEMTLRNVGAGPGYFDWLRLEAPEGVEILPFDRDKVDNDNDGEVDEPDESVTALVGPASTKLARSRATQARWSGPGGGALGGGERLVRPEGARIWRAALKLDADTPPARAFELKLEAQFGAQPVQRSAGEARSRVLARPVIATAAVTGLMALTETSVGRDISSTVRTGERVQHRLTIRMPAGKLADGIVTIDFDRAFRTPDRLEARFGRAVRCAGDPKGRLAKREHGAGWRAVWALGDCVVDPDAPDDARLIIVDLAAAVSDADPSLPQTERAAWRLPRVVGRISYADPRAKDGRAEAVLGAADLQIEGPALQLLVAPARWTGAKAAEADRATAQALDAGDRYVSILRIVNVGDKPAAGAVVDLGWADGAEGSAARRVVDCAALTLKGLPSAASISRRSPCLVRAFLDFSAAPLAPGAGVELELHSRLSAAAPIAAPVSTPIVVRAAPLGLDIEALKRFDGWATLSSAPKSTLAWAVTTRAPAPPTLDLARRGRKAAIGDALLARGRFAAPEGRGPVDLVLRFWFEGRGGAIARAERPALQVLNLTLARSRADMKAAANPSDINAAPVDAAIALRPGAYRLRVDEKGAAELVVPLGELGFDGAVDARSDGRYTLTLTAELKDIKAASRGRRLMASAELRRKGEADKGVKEAVWRSPPRIMAEIAEPLLDLAALHDDADGSVQLGERVVFVGRACNRGVAPAYGALIIADLPAGFSLDPGEAPSFRFDDGPEVLGPRPYGIATVDPAGRIIGAAADQTPIEPGACVALRAPAFARRPATALKSGEGLFAAPSAVARFEVLSYRGRPSRKKPGRLYSGLGPSTTVVRRRDLLLDAAAVAYQSIDGWIRHPFTVRIAPEYGDARLTLVLKAGGALEWTIFLDKNKDGRVDAEDRVWRDGDTLPAGVGLAFVARARPAKRLPIGWRSSALLRAAAATRDGRLLTGAREMVAARGSQRDGVMSAVRIMAVDRDCDGRLDDETAQDAAFERTKDVASGECVVMRVTFRNNGAASVERVQIVDVAPKGVVLLPGTAKFASTPAGLVGRGIDLMKAGSGNDRVSLRFRFVGALAPGLKGVVEYRVRIRSDEE